MARRGLTKLAVFATAFFPHLWGQSQQTSLRGRIVDPTHAPISGAQINVAADGQVSGVSATSDQNGEFSLTLETGKSQFKIYKERFSDASFSVDVPSEGLDMPDIVLQIASVNSAVTVTEHAGY